VISLLRTDRQLSKAHTALRKIVTGLLHIPEANRFPGTAPVIFADD